MNKFRVLDQAVDFYQSVQDLEIKGNLKDQLHRAASSISLNLAEGNAKANAINEKRHFFQTGIWFAQRMPTIFKLTNTTNHTCVGKADILGGALYKLIKSDLACFHIEDI